MLNPPIDGMFITFTVYVTFEPVEARAWLGGWIDMVVGAAA